MNTELTLWLRIKASWMITVTIIGILFIGEMINGYRLSKIALSPEFVAASFVINFLLSPYILAHIKYK
jgi:hypothetical protein